MDNPFQNIIPSLTRFAQKRETVSEIDPKRKRKRAKNTQKTPQNDFLPRWPNTGHTITITNELVDTCDVTLESHQWGERNGLNIEN